MTGAVIVAAGQGVRLGAGVPKGLRPLAGRPLYVYSLEAVRACPWIEAVVLVVPADHLDSVASAGQSGLFHESVRVVSGGDSRQQSVLFGIRALPATVDWVAVHDAARPLVTPELFAGVVRLAMEKGGAVAAHAATDTIKRCGADGAVTTLPRQELWHAETPQVFARQKLKAALEECERCGLVVTDESEAMERSGAHFALYPNPEPNPKINTEADWHWVEDLVQRR